MSKPTDVRPTGADLYFLPITNRVPLKFGPEVTTEVTCARVCLGVNDAPGRLPTAGARRRSRCSGSGRRRSRTRSGSRP